jgi:hypothetical protein
VSAVFSTVVPAFRHTVPARIGVPSAAKEAGTSIVSAAAGQTNPSVAEADA